MVKRRLSDDGSDPVAGRHLPRPGDDGVWSDDWLSPNVVDDAVEVVGSGPLVDRLSGMDSETEVIEVVGSGPLVDRLSGMDSETEVIEHVVDADGDDPG